MFESLLRISRSVRRTGSGKYLLLMLISFAISLSGTRAFLNLTGFPKIGSGNLHIAHVLWGGLLLYIATLIPLLFANRWVYPLSAILSGIGIGLFIDEVGKFITSTNDYFYPPAAPIIYSFFVISTLLYVRIRRSRIIQPKAALFKAFDMMEEVLEHEMDYGEKMELITLLDSVRDTSTDQSYVHLATALLDFLTTEKAKPIQKKYYLPEKILLFCDKQVNRFFSVVDIHYVSSISMILLGVFDLIFPIRFFISIPFAARMPMIIHPYMETNILSPHSNLDWFTARLALQGMVSLILIFAGVLILAKKVDRGLSFGFLGMLLMLTTVDLLIFYYDQFSTIVYVAIQVVIFLLVLQYRKMIRLKA
jgi:hypothetical protein